MVKELYTHLLRAAGEPCRPSTLGVSETVYRFLWFRTQDLPVVVRVELTTKGNFAMAKVVGYLPAATKFIGDSPERTISYGPRELTAEDLSLLATSLEMAGFWSLETQPDRPPAADGADWVLEGWRGGEYQAVRVWSPTSPGKYVRFAELCKAMLKVAGLTVDPRRVY